MASTHQGNSWFHPTTDCTNNLAVTSASPTTTAERRIIISYFFGPGQIPLGEHCARACEALGWEVARFNSNKGSVWYSALIKPLNKIARAIVRRDVEFAANTPLHPEVYRENGLLNLVREFRPQVLLVIRGPGFRPGFVELLSRDYGVRTLGWWVKGPKWFDLMTEEARHYQAYFCIHKDGYDPEETGIQHLPAQALPDTPEDKSATDHYRHEISFVGSWHPRRQSMMMQLADLPIAIYGPKWRRKNILNPRIFFKVKRRGIWGEAVSQLYRESKINLNIAVWDTSKQSGTNLRIAEVPAAGGFLLSEHSPELSNYLVPGVEIETYRSVEELREKIVYYLEHEPDRRDIARRGWLRAKSLPTYKILVARLLEPYSGNLRVTDSKYPH
jgi:spore maturation protein CgeB